MEPWHRHAQVDRFAHCSERRQPQVRQLAFLWLPSAEFAIARVRRRVGEGGHFVPDDVVRRRYVRGIANLRETFLPMADEVWLFDSGAMPPRIVAKGPPAALSVQRCFVAKTPASAREVFLRLARELGQAEGITFTAKDLARRRRLDFERCRLSVERDVVTLSVRASVETYGQFAGW